MVGQAALRPGTGADPQSQQFSHQDSFSLPQFPGFDDLYCKFCFVYGQDWVPTAVRTLKASLPARPTGSMCVMGLSAGPWLIPRSPHRAWRRASPRLPPRATSHPPHSSGTSPLTLPSRAPIRLAVSAGGGGIQLADQAPLSRTLHLQGRRL